MKILDNNDKVVFSGDWYPSAVVVFFRRKGKDAYEYSVLEYLKDYWQDSLSSFIKRFPCFTEAKSEDTILVTNNNVYLIPWDMEDNNEPEAWEFWQNILEQEFPGYHLEDSECEIADEDGYLSKEKAQEYFDDCKDYTDYFDGEITYKEIYDIFRYRLGFSESATKTILSALVICGAKFII